jgi:hypothetical protein
MSEGKSGSRSVGYYHAKNAPSRIIYYNPVYDVGLATEWDESKNNEPLLRKFLLVPGELLRGAQVKFPGPGWVDQGSLNGMIDAYKAVHEQTRKGSSEFILENAEKTHEWTLLNGQQMDDLTVVHQRIAAVGTSLLSYNPSAKIDQLPPDTAKMLDAVKPAVDAASDLENCLKGGGAFENVLSCEQAKRPFKTVSLPKTVANQNELGVFLGTTFVEGAIPIGNIAMSFISSYSQANNYLFALTTVDGEPAALSLIDLYAQ